MEREREGRGWRVKREKGGKGRRREELREGLGGKLIPFEAEVRSLEPSRYTSREIVEQYAR